MDEVTQSAKPSGQRPLLAPRERGPLLARIRAVFSPGAPVDQGRLFAGRIPQVRQVINAVYERGMHVVLYGERGVGKTSLANVLGEILDNPDLQVLGSRTINCDPTDTFSTLWRKILRELSITVPRQGTGFHAQPVNEEYTARDFVDETTDLTPDDIRYTLQKVQKPMMIIIDEMDRLKNKTVTQLLADTIKNLSDHSVRATLVLVGVADSVTELIGEHRSIERALVQVHMPRMSLQELFQILETGLEEVRMTIDGDAKARIGKVSLGLPYVTHLLGLYSAQHAVGEGRRHITRLDVEAAIRAGLDTMEQSTKEDYAKATRSHRTDSLYEHVLLACALAKTDELGFFAAADVRTPMSTIMRRTYEIPAFSRHLHDFCERQRGPVLQRIGEPRKHRFRFINPLMEPFTILHGLSRGILTDEMLQELVAEESDQTGLRERMVSPQAKANHPTTPLRR